jgi:prolyl-tRNA editing enzyme YbaK/EbsC (Cys-tRNA(Pro) deacylase)
MTNFTLGALEAAPASGSHGLLATPTAALISRLGWGERLGAVAIDPTLSDTAAFVAAYGVTEDTAANCVVVAGQRNGVEKVAACVILAHTRADVNGVVRKLLDVRKASFMPLDEAVERTGMEYGGITPIGLPAEWPILIDSRVADTPLVTLGAGVRAAKIIAPGPLLAELPGAQVIDGLARDVPALQ